MTRLRWRSCLTSSSDAPNIEAATAAAGRPPAENPKRTQISFRVDDSVLGALGKYQASLNVTELPLADAVRDLVVKAMKREGLL